MRCRCRRRRQKSNLSRRMNFFKLELRKARPWKRSSICCRQHSAAMAPPDALVTFPVASRKPTRCAGGRDPDRAPGSEAAADAAETAWKAANAARDDVKAQAVAILTARANDCEATTQVPAELTITGLPMRGGAGAGGAARRAAKCPRDHGRYGRRNRSTCGSRTRRRGARRAASRCTCPPGAYTDTDPTTKSKLTQGGLVLGDDVRLSGALRRARTAPGRGATRW